MKKSSMFEKYPDVVEVDDLRKMLGGISRRLAYRLLAEQEIRCVKVGRAYKIPNGAFLVAHREVRASQGSLPRSSSHLRQPASQQRYLHEADPNLAGSQYLLHHGRHLCTSRLLGTGGFGKRHERYVQPP